MDKELEWKQELAHFAYCQSVISENIKRYGKEYEARQAQVKRLYRAVSGGDVELYNQLMTAVSLEEQAQTGLNKNQAAFQKPYFGRIDYTELKTERPETVYIGKNGIFQNKTDVLIADWRAPISGVYYENELGPGDYGLPDESRIQIDLKGKRTYDASQGRLNGYYDSDIASNDELLVKYLSRNKDVVLGEIIATIQKEQNAIIRESPFANLIVQGVAGSGKTTVAMHRISYLLYNYKERFEANEYCIIGSSDLLLNYITSGLPELDVPDIKHMRMEQLFIRLCEKDWTKKHKAVPPDDTAQYRCTLPFMQALELFLMKKREEIVDCRPLEDSEAGTILTLSSNTTLLKEHPCYSIRRLLSVLDDRAKTRIRFLMSGGDRDEIQSMLRKYAGHYRAMMPKTSIHGLYREFLEGLESFTGDGNGNGKAALEKHLAQTKQGHYDLYDIAALALIHYRVTQLKPNEEFGLLFLDEAQDFGLSAYYVLKQVLPDTYFTIMGDVSQNINYETGMNDWYELTKLFLTGPRDKFLLLQKSYRNTIEISEYAGKILDKASSGRYKITPVIRHGLPVREVSLDSEAEMAAHAAALIEDFREKSYSTTAVICDDEQEAERVRALLGLAGQPEAYEDQNFTTGTMVLPIRLVKGLEFDTVILWNPHLRQSLERPDKAKLMYVAATRALHELHVLERA